MQMTEAVRKGEVKEKEKKKKKGGGKLKLIMISRRKTWQVLRARKVLFTNSLRAANFH